MSKLLNSLKIAAIVGLFGLGIVESVYAAKGCTIKLLKKSPTSKTAYTLKGESISDSIINKLRPQCNFELRLMSLAEKRHFDIKNLQKRLVKLKGLRIR